jgi:hypothetical protein
MPQLHLVHLHMNHRKLNSNNKGLVLEVLL